MCWGCCRCVREWVGLLVVILATIAATSWLLDGLGYGRRACACDNEPFGAHKQLLNFTTLRRLNATHSIQETFERAPPEA
jgi:hypothetical protein